MKSFFGWLIGGVLVIGVLIAIDFNTRKHLGPLYEGIRHDIHKESQSYNDGMKRRMNTLYMEYQTAAPAHQKVIRGTVLHETADYDISRLSPELQTWIRQLKGNHIQAARDRNASINPIRICNERNELNELNELNEMNQEHTTRLASGVMSLLALLIAAGALFMTGCEYDDADSVQRRQTNQMMAEATQQVGMPDIFNWAELKNAKMIMELRDSELLTYAYIVDLNGGLHYLGEAIGYGLPYSVQMTNPEKRAYSGSATTLPQAEPNGLFMPEGLSATWIMLLDPETEEIKPVYVEPQILVSPIKLKTVGTYQLR